MTSISYGQTFDLITYEVIVNKDQIEAKVVSDYVLKYDKEFSYFTPASSDPLNKLAYKNEGVETGRLDSLVQIKMNSGTKVKSYLDYHTTNLNTGDVFFNENIQNKLYNIKESNRKPTWEIVAMTRDTLIAGYKCQKAYGSFMGRKYEAYFTPDIVTTAAPFKFRGLPGLILSLKSLDNYVNIEAKTLNLNNTSDVQKINTTLPSNPLSYEGFWSLMRFTYETNTKKALAKMSATKTDEDEHTVSIEFKDFMEIPNIKPIELKY